MEPHTSQKPQTPPLSPATAVNGFSSPDDVIAENSHTPQETDTVIVVRALYPYVSEDPNTISLSFDADDLIQVVTQLDSGWWYGFCNQNRGWFPSNFVEEITQSDLEDDDEDEDGEDNDNNEREQHIVDEEHEHNGLSHSHSHSHSHHHSHGHGQADDQDDDDQDTTDSDEDSANSTSAPASHTNEDPRSRRSTAASISSSTLSGPDALRDNMTHDQQQQQQQLRQSSSSNGQVMMSSRAMGSVQEQGETDSHAGSSRPNSWQASAVPTRVGSPHSQDGLLNHAQASSSASANLRKPSSTGAPGCALASDAAEDGLPPLPIVSNPLDPEPTWASLEEHASATLLNLIHSADNGYKPYYQIQAAQVVESIRVMFYASGMIDKDSTPIRTHGDLKVYHRQIMAALSRLILSAKMASSVWPAEGSVAKMRSDAGEVATAVHEFIIAARNANITVHDVDAKLVADPESIINAAAQTPRHSQNLARSVSSTSRPSLDGGDRSSANGGAGSGGNAKTGLGSATVLTPLEYYCKSACRAIGVLSLQITKAVDSVQGMVLQSGPNVMNSAQSSQLVTQCHNAISHTGSLLALVSEYYSTVVAEHPGIKDHILLDVRVSKQALYNNVASLVMSIQLATDPMARMNVLEMALEATHTAEQSVLGLAAATRSLALASDEMEKGTKTRITSEITASSDSFLMDDSDLEGDMIKSSSRHRRSESRLSSFSSGSSAAPSLASGVSGVDTFTRSSAAVYASSQGSSNNPAIPINALAPVEVTASRQPISSSDRDQQRARGLKMKKIFGEDVVLAPKKSKAVEVPWYLQHDSPSSEISFNMEGFVKGGTLAALVERLTLHDTTISASFGATFLLTYRSFTTTTEFFTLLFRRFTISPPPGLEGSDLTQWTDRKLTPIRLRVFNTIKTWLELYYMEDEQEDRQMLPKIKEFSSLMRHSMSFAAVQIIKLVEKREASDGSLRRMVLHLTTQAPQPITPRNLKKIKFLELDPLEFARQLTIMEANTFNKIKPVECLAKAWTSEDPEIAAKAVNIKKMIETANLYANWINEIVLQERDVKKRSLIIRHLIAVAEKLRSLNNFSLLYATTAALALSPVHRLKRTWELVPSKAMSTYATLQAVTNSAKSWTDYRQALHSADPPCVPFVGVYLTDLVMIQDGNPDFLKGAEHHINFAKRVSTAEVIREIQRYQNEPYCLTTVPEIQAFIRRGLDQSKPVADLHELSLELEPREGEEEKITRLLAEAGFL
ncbi:hypothetical protein BGX29_001408 [Mortierella sp. GBA35]|nr:hypothetical protein BGX29_001408 [Mortierella sp. GBA35]